MIFHFNYNKTIWILFLTELIVWFTCGTDVADDGVALIDCHEGRGKHNRVEWNVVLGHELIELHLSLGIRGPPLRPLLRVALGDTHVSYRRVEPHVEHLSGQSVVLECRRTRLIGTGFYTDYWFVRIQLKKRSNSNLEKTNDIGALKRSWANTQVLGTQPWLASFNKRRIQDCLDGKGREIHV